MALQPKLGPIQSYSMGAEISPSTLCQVVERLNQLTERLRRRCLRHWRAAAVIAMTSHSR